MEWGGRGGKGKSLLMVSVLLRCSWDQLALLLPNPGTGGDMPPVAAWESCGCWALCCRQATLSLQLEILQTDAWAEGIRFLEEWVWRTTQILVKCTGQTISNFGSGPSHAVGRGLWGVRACPSPFRTPGMPGHQRQRGLNLLPFLSLHEERNAETGAHTG